MHAQIRTVSLPACISLMTRSHSNTHTLQAVHNGIASFSGVTLAGPPATGLALLFTHCVAGASADTGAVCTFSVASASFTLAAAPAALVATRNLSRTVLRASDWDGSAAPGPVEVRLVDAGGVWVQWYAASVTGGNSAPTPVGVSLCVSTNAAAGDFFCRGEITNVCRPAADLFAASLEGKRWLERAYMYARSRTRTHRTRAHTVSHDEPMFRGIL